MTATDVANQFNTRALKIAYQHYKEHRQPPLQDAYFPGWGLATLMGFSYSPYLNRDFYAREISQAVASIEIPRIIITGAANHHMLALVHEVTFGKANRDILFLDRSSIAIEINKKFAESLGISIKVERVDFERDIPHLPPGHLVVTDRLTDFISNKPKLAQNWAKLLEVSGRLVTVCTEYPANKTPEEKFGSRRKLRIAGKVGLTARQHNIQKRDIPALYKGLIHARQHIPSDCLAHIVQPLQDAGFSILHHDEKVIGTALGPTSREKCLELAAVRHR